MRADPSRDFNAEVADAIRTGDMSRLCVLAVELAGIAMQSRKRSKNSAQRQQRYRDRQAQETARNDAGDARTLTLRNVTHGDVTGVTSLSPLVPPSPLPPGTPNSSPPFNPPSPRKSRRAAADISPTPDELLVLQHYVTTHPRRRWGPKDVRAVRSALGLGFSTQDCFEAIDGNAADQWHRDKHKHELPYVLRDAGTIDGFREKGEKRKQPFDWSRYVKDGWMTDELERLTRPAGVLSA